MRFLSLLFILLVFIGCDITENTSETETITSTESIDKKVIIYEVVKVSDLYSEPNLQSTKLVNQKATEQLGKLYYMSIDKSCKVSVIDTVDGWSKIQVTEPYWLADSHIGWVQNEVIRDTNLKKEEVCLFEENKDYQVLYSKEQGRVINYHILLLSKGLTENELENLTNCIKKEKSPSLNCNISIYDTADIISLIEKYPLKGTDYVRLADHYVYLLSFDGMSMYYPLKDVQYKEYGGKHPIR